MSRFLMVGLAAAFADALTKVWAEQELALHQPVPIIGPLFQLTLGYNTGTAFGLFADGGSWLLIATGAIIVGLSLWLLVAQRVGTFPRMAWPLGLLLGGAAANFADRWLDGRVTDFLDVGLGASRWPTFNLADSFIVIGVTTLLVTNLGACADSAPAPR